MPFCVREHLITAQSMAIAAADFLISFSTHCVETILGLNVLNLKLNNIAALDDIAYFRLISMLTNIPRPRNSNPMAFDFLDKCFPSTSGSSCTSIVHGVPSVHSHHLQMLFSHLEFPFHSRKVEQ